MADFFIQFKQLHFLQTISQT